jgi:predicted RNase H-like HicB family nuclease
MTKYLVIYEQGADGAWGAYSPDLDGAFALGRTRAEVAERMLEAVAAYIEVMREDGLPIPAPCHHAEYITVPATVTGGRP